MKKRFFLQLIKATVSLMCCTLLIFLIPTPNDEDNTPGIEIENPLPGDEGDEHYTPQDDNYPFDGNTDD